MPENDGNAVKTCHASVEASRSYIRHLNDECLGQGQHLLGKGVFRTRSAEPRSYESNPVNVVPAPIESLLSTIIIRRLELIWR